MMFPMISRRFYHSSNQYFNAATSALGRLRKSTGYSVSNCKKALELFEGDVSKAEEWLHEEAKKKGWSKWANIQARTASQGLIGVYSKDTYGAMVEINCETDFVSKNAEFQSFVGKVLSCCVNYVRSYQLPDHRDMKKVFIDKFDLNSLKFEGVTVGELVGAATFKFNEKTVVKQAVCLKSQNHFFVNSLSHPLTECSVLPGASLGKYGVLLAFKQRPIFEEFDMDKLGLDLCQHIIGMNPLSIGEFTEKDLIALEKQRREKKKEVEAMKKTNVTEENTENESNEDEDEATKDEVSLKDADETRLLYQQFLLDPNVNVGETVLKSGVEVMEFVRFECGETVPEESETVAKSASA